MSTLRLTTISNQSGSSSVPSDTVINGSAKAWVNFNGTGTVAIRASFNVSSITDNGVGLYQVNFTSALVDANFAVVITGGGQGASGSTYAVDAGSATTAKVNIRSRAVSGGAAVDEDPFSVSVFR